MFILQFILFKYQQMFTYQIVCLQKMNAILVLIVIYNNFKHCQTEIYIF